MTNKENKIIENTKMNHEESLSKKKKAIIAGGTAAGVAAVVAVISVVSLTAGNNAKYTVSMSSDLAQFQKADIKIDKGTKIKDLKNIIAVPEGFVVEKFYKDIDCTEPFDEETQITENINIYVKFEVAKFTVKAYEDTSKTKLLEEKIVEYKKSAELTNLDKPEDKVGRYTFVGWVDSQGNIVDTNSITRDLEVFAKFDIDYNEYLVTINDRDNNIQITKAGVVLEGSATLHYNERIGIVIKENLGYKQTAFNVVGATKDESTGLYIVEDNVTITYEEEYVTYVMGTIPKQVTINKIVNNDISRNEKVSVKKGDELLHGQILEIYYTTTTDYSTTEFEISGAYIVSGSENLYGITSDLVVIYKEEWAGEGEEPVEDVMLYEKVAGGYCVIGIEEDADVTNIIIPNTHAGEPVVAIKRIAPDNKKSLIKSLTIPENIQKMEDYSMSSLVNLETLYFNAINAGDYHGRNGIFSDIGVNCSGTTVIFGDSVEHIPDRLFTSESISYDILDYNIINVTIGKNVKSIGNMAFEYCKNLTNISIPNSITYIGDLAFSDCNKLQYYEYDNARYLGNSETPYLVLVEAKDKNITTCEINSNTKIICYYAFSGCSGLTSITIPEGVTSIGSSAFMDCSSLTSIIIPNRVTSIERGAFSGCGNLVSVTFEDTTGWYLANYSFETTGTDIDVTDAAINATNLNKTYTYKYLKKKQ